jgi:serine/threonine protein kinase
VECAATPGVSVATQRQRPRVQYDTVLGRGAFKTVYKGFDEREGIEVAWNQVRSRDFMNEGHKLTQEISVLKNMKHKNVMYFYDSWVDEQNGTVNFITELFTSGTLRQCVPALRALPEQRWCVLDLHNGRGDVVRQTWCMV